MTAPWDIGQAQGAAHVANNVGMWVSSDITAQ